MSVISAGLVTRTRINGTIEYLFIEYKKYHGLHGLCGGHSEGDETEIDTITREFREELGVDVFPTKKLHTMPSDIKGDTINIWECNLNSEDFVIQKNEIVAAKWFSHPEIINSPELFFPAIHQFFKKSHTLL
jgi:8-oxo-dGTP pyrophosphatase MutT (NUDIX family)